MSGSPVPRGVRVVGPERHDVGPPTRLHVHSSRWELRIEDVLLLLRDCSTVDEVQLGLQDQVLPMGT